MDDGIITASDAGRDFPRLLETVEAGSSVTITRDGRPVAVMQPADNFPGEEREVLRQQMLALMRQGIDVDYQGPLNRDALHER